VTENEQEFAAGRARGHRGTFATTYVSAATAYFSRETYCIEAHDRGDSDATPIPKVEHERRRQEAIDLVEAD
jgi:hypothetical protein